MPKRALQIALVAAVALLPSWWFLLRGEGGDGGNDGAGAAPKWSSPSFVGSAACAGCHAVEHAAWQGSQHARAMQHATESAVLGNFDDARFVYAGVTSRFFRRDGRFFVRTDGPDGQLADFEIKYTFGVEPLQQYLIELPGGRLQALSISWDTRAREVGGQRWFHLYPQERIDHRDPLHWTKPAQNWNFMCADCHSTDVRKGYNADKGAFDTQWSDITVGCEACHGPGSAHLAAPRAPYRRDVEGRNAAEISACAACHSRRSQFAEGARAGDALMDHYLPAVLSEGLYHADGQQRDEVFIWGSFVQSRKHAAGVTCGACHEPHTQKIRLPGNAVCTQCHVPKNFDTPAHHHHASGSLAAECVSCHMRENTYMVIDRRRDHGFHIPRPDLTMKLGTPNACADCHAERGAEWADAAITRWYGTERQRPHFAETLAAGRTGAAGAVGKLRTLALDSSEAAIVRASALELMSRYPGESTGEALRLALSDPDPLVRYQALVGRHAPNAERLAALIAPALDDAVRANRHEAARQLTSARASLADPALRARLAGELDDFERALRHDLSRSEAWVNLGNLQSARGDIASAESSYRSAIRLEPNFVPAWVNLADLLRSSGRESEVESLLREGLVRNADSPALREALGFSLVRQARKQEALREFAAAHRAARDVPRFSYVYALALQDAGRKGEAKRVLMQGLERGFDREVLVALALFARDSGDDVLARRALARLREVNPGDPALANLRE